jgi:hypothetical protein
MAQSITIKKHHKNPKSQRLIGQNQQATSQSKKTQEIT